MRRNAKNKAASGLAACDMQIKKGYVTTNS